MPIEIVIPLLIVVGLAVSAIALIHPAGLALLVLLITPFDPLMTNIFGLAGNYITLLPILLVLIKNRPSTWVQVFLGTRVQRAFFFFVLIAGISFTIGYTKVGPEASVVYLQRIAGVALAGVLAVELRNAKYLDLCMKVLVAGMALFALLSMLEFYVGIQILPTGGGYTAGGLAELERTANVHKTRLPGAGHSVPINRLALQLLLPIGLAMGWFVSGMRRSGGLVQIGCLIVLLSALFGTMSRSGLLGLVVGAAVVAFSAYRLRPTMVFGTLILALVLGFGASQVLSYFDVDDELRSRLATSDLDTSAGTREAAWTHGLRLFADSPIWGVGYGVVTTDNVARTFESRDPHNAYIRILSFYGLLGAGFFVYLIWATWSALLKSRVLVAGPLEFWRPYFLAGFCALLTVNMFNSYFFDRFMYIIIGFAAAIEGARRIALHEQKIAASGGELASNTRAQGTGRPGGDDSIGGSQPGSTLYPQYGDPPDSAQGGYR